MNTVKTMKTTRRIFPHLLGASLLILLLAGTPPPSDSTAPFLLSEERLHRNAGFGFWDDPCTWDGFAFGAGLVGCFGGKFGGCLSAVVGYLKAVKSDGCF